MANENNPSRRLLPWAFLLLLILPAHTLSAQATAKDLAAKPKLTSAQAIEIAKDYCAKIGEPVTAPGTAAFPDKADPEALGDYWLAQWDIMFPRQAEVRVADGNRVVTFYFNKEHEIEYEASQTPAGPAIPQAQAEHNAQKPLDATGTNPRELDNMTATLHMINPAQDLAIHHYWSIEWNRSFNGIPYFAQGASVALDAQTGEVYLVELALPSPPITQAILKVTKQQAIEVAQKQLADDVGFIGYATIDQANLEIVQPNNGGSRIQDADDYSRTARCAWGIRYGFFLPFQRGGDIDTWVDTQTGKVIRVEGAAGPSTRAAAAARPIPPYPLNQVLPSVTAAYVRQSSPSTTSRWLGVPHAAFTAKAQPRQLNQLKESKATSAPPASSGSTMQVILVDKDNSLDIYEYDPTTGLLGSGTDWVTLPPKLKTWLQQRFKSDKNAGVTSVRKQADKKVN